MKSHDNGVAQMTSLLLGVTDEGQKERQLQTRLRKSLLSLLSQCHTLCSLSVTLSMCCPGRQMGDTLLLRSIRPAFCFLSYTHTQTTQAQVSPHSQMSFYWSVPGGVRHALFITALRHHRYCQSSCTGCGPRLRNVLFSYSSPVQIPSLGQGHIPVAVVKNTEKISQLMI